MALCAKKFEQKNVRHLHREKQLWREQRSKAAAGKHTLTCCQSQYESYTKELRDQGFETKLSGDLEVLRRNFLRLRTEKLSMNILNIGWELVLWESVH